MWGALITVIQCNMSNDAEATPSKQRTIGTPWKPGQSGNPAGRPRGSRNRLQDAFVTDLRDLWTERGREILVRVATDQPEVMLKVVASLMPKSVDLNVEASVDVTTFARDFRHALSLLGNEPPRRMRTIEGKSNDR